MTRKNKAHIKSIRKHSRQLVRELDVLRIEYSDTGCTFSQCHVLFELSQKPAGLKELANVLLMDKSNTSRLVKKLVQDKLVAESQNSQDSRQKTFSVTRKGKQVLHEIVTIAERQVTGAMSHLSNEEQQQAIHGLKLYAGALRTHRLQDGFEIRRIRKKDNAAVANVIREVMKEFNAVGQGYSIVDPEIDDMFGNYRDDNKRFYVVDSESDVLGCAGIAPLAGGNSKTCELRKMFFKPEIRKRGLGKSLLRKLISDATEIGYEVCYLESLKRMDRAIKLYRMFGFKELKQPMGNTGHCSSDLWMKLDLR